MYQEQKIQLKKRVIQDFSLKNVGESRGRLSAYFF